MLIPLRLSAAKPHFSRSLPMEMQAPNKATTECRDKLGSDIACRWSVGGLADVRSAILILNRLQAHKACDRPPYINSSPLRTAG